MRGTRDHAHGLTAERPRALQLAAAIGVALAAVLCGTAATAHAGQVKVHYRIQGAGEVAVLGTGLLCNQTANLTSSTSDCGDLQITGSGAVGFRLSPTRAGQGFSFDGWLGCEGDAYHRDGSDCVITSEHDLIADVTAVFKDPNPPSFTNASISYPADRTARVNWDVDEGTVRCRIAGPADDTNYDSCRPGHQFTNLNEGDFTVFLEATDGSHNRTELTLRGKIVDTSLERPLPRPQDDGPIAVATQAFRFSSGAGTSFRCSLDDGSFLPCGDRIAGTSASEWITPELSDNSSHTVRVKAVNGSYSDPVPASYTFWVDRTSPDTALLANGESPNEKQLSEQSAARFFFESVGEGHYLNQVRFKCSLDAAAPVDCQSGHRVDELAPGSHSFRVWAIDAAGNQDPTPATRNWSVLAPDDDGDGFRADQDCNDHDAAIHPGAREIPGNDVDENCDHVTTPRPVIVSPVPYRIANKGNYMVVRRLSVVRPPQGAEVQLSCKGPGCRFKPRAKRVVRSTGELAFAAAFKGRKLRPGAVIEVRITHPEMVGKFVRIKIGHGKATSDTLCLTSAARKPTACPDD